MISTNILALAFLILLSAFFLLAYVAVEIHKATLSFLAENLSVGGQPIALVKQQQSANIEIQKDEMRRLDELRAARLSSAIGE